MGEFIRAISQMTAPVQQIMFERAKTVVSQAASVVESVKKNRATYFVGGMAVASGCLYMYKGTDYFWMKHVLQQAKHNCNEVKKREIPENILWDFEKRAQILFDGIEKKIASLDILVQSLNKTNVEYSKQAQELNESQKTAHEQIINHIQVIERLFSEIKDASDKLGKLYENIEKVDGHSYWVYEETIKHEKQIKQLLEEQLKKYS